MADKQAQEVDESAATATATADGTGDAAQAPKLATQEEVQRVLKQAEDMERRAEERERNAREALRASNDRNREANVLADQTRQSQLRMEAVLQGLPALDPDSPIAKAIQNAANVGGANGNGGAREIPNAVLNKVDALERVVGEQSKILTAVQLERVGGQVDHLARQIFKSDKEVAGLEEEQEYARLVRERVFQDPVCQTATDPSVMERRAREIAAEVSAKITSYAKRGIANWKGKRTADTGTAAPTGRDSAPATAGSTAPKRIKYDGRNWDRYLAEHGAKE